MTIQKTEVCDYLKENSKIQRRIDERVPLPRVLKKQQ